MEPIQSKKKKLLIRVFEESVKVINRMVDLDDFKSTYFPNEDRTLAMFIEGMEDLPTGYTFEEGKVRMVDKFKDEPTVSLFMDEDTFLSIACQEITMEKAWFLRMLKMEGENYLRDFRIFQIMFNRYPQVMDTINPIKK